MNIPKDVHYPPDSVLCDECGGLGCVHCGDRGWLTPRTNPSGRRCAHEKCSQPLPPQQPQDAKYCTDACALADA